MRNICDIHKNTLGKYIEENFSDELKRIRDVKSLGVYRNTFWERIIREEVKQAAQDGKTKLQFPTGETAMKIEGLGERARWEITQGDEVVDELLPENMEIGLEIYDGGDTWIITEVLGDGKFKAMPKEHFDSFQESMGTDLSGEDLISYAEQHGTENFWASKETFDISGKVDTNNPIYKFYEKDVAKYLKNKYNGKIVTDDKGVSWVEVDITPDMAKKPVVAFKKGSVKLDTKGIDAIAKLKSHLKRLGLTDVQLQLVDDFFSSDEGIILAATMGNNVTFREFVTALTAEHELVHIIFENMDNMKLFTEQGLTRDVLLKELRKENPDKSDYDLEEIMAEKFEEYIKTYQQPNQIYKSFFDAIIRVFRKIFSTKDGRSAMDKFFSTLAEGVATETVSAKKSLVTPAEFTKFVDGKIITDFTGIGWYVDSPEYKKINPEDFLELKQESQRRLNEYMQSDAVGLIEAEIAMRAFELDKYDSRLAKGIKRSKYYKKERMPSEAMGSGYLIQKGDDKYVVIEAKDLRSFLSKGYSIVAEVDSLAQEAGFENGFDYLQEQIRLSDISKQTSDIKKIAKNQLLATDEQYRKMVDQIEEVRSDIRGKNVKRETLLTEQARRRVMIKRRNKVRIIRDFFNLSDDDLNSINQRDIRLMTDNQFKNYLKFIEEKAFELTETRIRKVSLLNLIEKKELKKVDNIRKAMELPPINEMTNEQLESFFNLLDQYEVGDEFLSQRQLETIDNTDLKGIRTYREAREALAKQAGVPIEELEKVKFSESDRFVYDTFLANRNPLYELLVNETSRALFEAEANTLSLEDRMTELVKKARSSRRKGIKKTIEGALVQTDKEVIEYIESSNKEELAKKLTPEELDLANFIISYYASARDYIAASKGVEGWGMDDYFTHVRRSFLESAKEDGLIAAIKEVWQQNKEDQIAFNIIDTDTGNILPLEKFFQFAQRRTGAIKPTQNLARGFMAYVSTLEKKKALDSLIPKMAVYTHVVSPRATTERGLEMDRRLQSFVKEYLNNKKGRRFTFGGAIPQGGKVDMTIRALRMVTSVLDLGLNLTTGVAANFGEEAFNIKMMGFQKYTKGIKRLNTKKGKKIVNKYKNFTGKTVTEEFLNQAKNIDNKIMTLLFGLFQSATTRANKIYLLGEMTDSEFQSETVSTDRLVEMKKEMMRFRVSPDMDSVISSTSAAKAVTQYKTWAIPGLISTLKNWKSLASKLKNDPKNVISSKEFQEELRGAILVTVATILIAYAYKPDDDEAIENKFISKAYRDIMSLISVLDPSTLTGVPRTIDFIAQIGEAIGNIIRLEEYKTKPGLKGVDQLIRNLTPMLIKQVVPKEQDSSDALLLPDLEFSGPSLELELDLSLPNLGE